MGLGSQFFSNGFAARGVARTEIHFTARLAKGTTEVLPDALTTPRDHCHSSFEFFLTPHGDASSKNARFPSVLAACLSQPPRALPHGHECDMTFAVSFSRRSGQSTSMIVFSPSR